MPNPNHERRLEPRLSRRSFIGLAGGTAAAALLDPAALLAEQPLSHSLNGSSNAVAPFARSAYAAESAKANTTIEEYLGAERCALEELRAHKDDNYYLGTPYGNTGPSEFSSDLSSWDCWHPNGKPKKNGEAYMNCTGFVVAVLEACGANCSKIGSYVAASGYDRGNKANLSRWKNWLDDHAYLRTRYTSKKALLESGKLKKGDIIIAEPNDWSQAGADNHILFFWGDSPSEDLAWHSASHGDGIVAGKAPGNMISRICAKFADCYWLHVPLENLLEVTLKKESADTAVANVETNSAYSLKGAQFSIFGAYNNGALSKPLGSFTTNENGKATVSLSPGSTVWLRENAAPKGFTLWSTPKKLTVGKTEQTVSLKDKPCKVTLRVEKLDSQTESLPQGHATLEGAVFQLVDANGEQRSARTAWDEATRSWSACFQGLPRGTTKIREAQAPSGYVLCPMEGADEGGWKTLTLTPDSHKEVVEAALLSHRNRVMLGSIEGVKFRESSEEDEAKTPLEGCLFQLWLEDDGTLEGKGYETAAIQDASGNPVLDSQGNPLKGCLMGTMESDENGCFSSERLNPPQKPRTNFDESGEDVLPFGTYTLVETFCPDPSVKLLEPICGLGVKADGAKVHLILEDRLIASPVRVRKIDAESGKPLLKEGTEIELLRKEADGGYQPVEFAVHYPEETVLKTFVVPASGEVQFPCLLERGSYAIREVSPVAPYLLEKEPVPFEVAEGRNWKDENLIEIALPNTAAQGAIELLKADSLTQEPLAGAEYEVRALENIATPDGTTHCKKGELMAAPITDEKGRWRVEGLSLGDGSARYGVKETKAPAGYVLDPKEHEVTLSYQDAETSLVVQKLEIKEQPTRATLTKADAVTGEPIEGTVFAVCPANEEKPKPITAKTDEKGRAEILRLEGGKEYLFYEQEARADLGYIRSDKRITRYLDPCGLWHETQKEYEQAKEESVAEAGEEECRIQFENNFTKVAVYKVDEDLWNALPHEQSDRKAKRLQQEALLEGGRFRMVDAEGKALRVIVDGKACDSWSASAEGPRIISRLRPGKRYAIIEVEAPKGYMRKSLRTEFSISNTTEAQVLVIGNRRLDTFPATSDVPSWIFPTTATALAGAAGAAFAAYSKRRTEVEQEKPRKRP